MPLEFVGEKHALGSFHRAVVGPIFPYVAKAAEQEFIIINVKIDRTNQPKNAGDLGRECANDATCASLLQAAGSFAGIPPAATATAIAILAVQPESSAQDHHIRILLPGRYRYCHSAIATTSLAPHSGDRAPTIYADGWDAVDRNLTGMGMYIVTPQQGLGQGRAWVEVDIKIIGVHPDRAEVRYADGTCNRARNALINCKRASCGHVED